MTVRSRRVGRPSAWWAVVPLAATAVLYVWPLGAIVRRSMSPFAGRRGLSLDTVGDVFTDRRLGEIAAFTVGQAALSTAVCVVLGTAVAAVWSTYETPARRVVGAVALVPFVMPTIVVGAAMVATQRQLGIDDPPAMLSIVAAHVVFNLGIVIRVVEQAFRSIPAAVDASAALLGARGLRRLVGVRLPLVMPSVLGVASVVALLCVTSFGVIVALGSGTATTIEVEIWVQATRTLNLPVAAVLTLAQLAVVVAVVGVVRHRQRLRTGATRWSAAVPSPRVVPRTLGARTLVWASSGIVASIVAIPLISLVVRSLRVGDRWQLTHYRHLGDALDGGSAAIDPWSALANSIVIALAAALIAFVVAVPAVAVGQRRTGLGRAVELLVALPLATSAATLGMGFLLAFSGPVVDLRGRWILVPAIQAAVAVPFVVRVLAPAVGGRTLAPVEAAATCGVGVWRRFREIVWPAARPAVAVSAGLALAVSLGEFGATAFVSRRDDPTLPIMIGRLLGRPGDATFGQAMAASCVLAALTLCVVGVLGWWSDRTAG